MSQSSSWASPPSPRTSRKVLVVAVVCLAVIGLTLAAYELRLWGDEKTLEVEGGAVVFQTEDRLTIRCLSTDLRISAPGFVGSITVSNCFPGSELEGYEKTPSWNGTVTSFEVDGGRNDYRLVAPQEDAFSFAVMGDSQGHNDILEKALNMTEDCDFVIHCGDLTPSGSTSELAAVDETLNRSSSPVFATPGNHDVKNYGPSGYIPRFGPTQYWFDYAGVRFAFVDSSDLNITPGQISWLEEIFSGADKKVIVTHGTSYDPIEGNHTLEPESCERLQSFALDNEVTAVFSGHVHAYYVLRVENTDFVITGGAGGTLTAGTYHWLRVNVTSSGLGYEKVDIEYSQTTPTVLILKGHGTTVNLSLEQLMAMQQLEGDSEYQNQFGNIAGTGHYKGVNVSFLLTLVGNISEWEILKVTAADSYFQEFGYGNVILNDTWYELQGPMIFALEFNGVKAPPWGDGPRIAFLPADGLYNNTDCNDTSYPGQGYSVYPSAGARWVKNVAMIEVI